jgi:hypothetical protein
MKSLVLHGFGVVMHRGQANGTNFRHSLACMYGVCWLDNGDRVKGCLYEPNRDKEEGTEKVALEMEENRVCI